MRALEDPLATEVMALALRDGPLLSAVGAYVADDPHQHFAQFRTWKRFRGVAIFERSALWPALRSVLLHPGPLADRRAELLAALIPVARALTPAERPSLAALLDSKDEVVRAVVAEAVSMAGCVEALEQLQARLTELPLTVHACHLIEVLPRVAAPLTELMAALDVLPRGSAQQHAVLFLLHVLGEPEPLRAAFTRAPVTERLALMPTLLQLGEKRMLQAHLSRRGETREQSLFQELCPPRARLPGREQ